MSFAFGFTQDASGDEYVAATESRYTLDDAVLDVEPESPQFAAKRVDVDDLLLTLVDVRLSYNQHPNLPVYKRALFDTMHQAMTEDNEQTNHLLLRNEADLTKNQYEGGFKVWEGSIDLVTKLTTFCHQAYTRIAEIGCGTALPSCYIFREKLRATDGGPLELVLTDYNYDVLRLVTLPNLLINWYALHHEEAEEGEFLVTQDIIDQFGADLKARNIKLEFISGAWGREFFSLVGQPGLVLTSETIYSLESIPVLTKILLELSFKGCICVVAAKEFYFGVGGSLYDFMNYLRENKKHLSLDVNETDSALKRTIITISDEH